VTCNINKISYCVTPVLEKFVSKHDIELACNNQLSQVICSFHSHYINAYAIQLFAYAYAISALCIAITTMVATKQHPIKAVRWHDVFTL